MQAGSIIYEWEPELDCDYVCFHFEIEYDFCPGEGSLHSLDPPEPPSVNIIGVSLLSVNNEEGKEIESEELSFLATQELDDFSLSIKAKEFWSDQFWDYISNNAYHFEEIILEEIGCY
ncbi:MAG: hypothetical protein ACXACY_13295 [Candidatus Hodarchaeales archaeon]|jgi:hypothetical protein